MWDPFTERARRVIVLAQEEAQRLGNNYIGTEHLLLGIISEGESSAFQALVSFGDYVSLRKIRSEVEAIVGKGGQVLKETVFTPRAKRVIELAFEEARARKHNYIAPGHLLLGLLRAGESVALRVLSHLLVIDELVARIDAEFPAPVESASVAEVLKNPVQSDWIVSVNLTDESEEVSLTLRGNKDCLPHLRSLFQGEMSHGTDKLRSCILRQLDQLTS